jgi:hypothetical protein
MLRIYTKHFGWSRRETILVMMVLLLLFAALRILENVYGFDSTWSILVLVVFVGIFLAFLVSYYINTTIVVKSSQGSAIHVSCRLRSFPCLVEHIKEFKMLASKHTRSRRWGRTEFLYCVRLQTGTETFAVDWLDASQAGEIRSFIMKNRPDLHDMMFGDSRSL